MKYKELKIGNWYSIGIDEVRNEYILETYGRNSNSSSYYSISEEEFNEFPWELDALRKYSSSRRFLCSSSSYGQSFEQLCRLYEKKIDENGCAVLAYNGASIYKTKHNEFICIKISEKDLPYDIYGIGIQSILPSLIVECLFGPRYYALKEIKPTAKEIVMDYIEKHKQNFKVVNKENLKIINKEDFKIANKGNS